MAERTNLKAYMAYSFLNTVSYCFPAHWIWDPHGWIYKLGGVDIAGCSGMYSHMIQYYFIVFDDCLQYFNSKTNKRAAN